MAARNPYRQIVKHDGLGKIQELSAPTQWELDQKIKAKIEQWDKQWERQQKAATDAEAKEEAERRTAEAEDVQDKLDSTLSNISADTPFSVLSLKSNAKFAERAPIAPALTTLPEAPDPDDEKYNPEMTFSMKLFKNKAEEAKRQAKEAYDKDMSIWQSHCSEVESMNSSAKAAYQEKLDGWNLRKSNFESEEQKYNDDLEECESGLITGTAAGIESYIETSIHAIELPFDFEFETDSEFNCEDKSLVLEVFLPAIEEFPTLKSVSYNKSKSEFKETLFSESAMKKKYDSVIYQLVLAIVHRAFTAGGENNPVESIVMNGRLRTTEKATGKSIEPVVLSVSTDKHSIEEINLDSVDAKAWFKSSKGVSAASIANVTPVAPIVQLSREDKRFIEGYSVSGDLNEGLNLAAMDWQDFENLIRELFEQEFSTPGGEVKITQASRDGGVDAVVFDPDPIRGGKIVIQAKRYTNTVGVSAVRDLYGTMMNEGAMKGILVTTSNYGNDAYDFAAGKPLTLMNGANLLYLLEKHGHKAKIDLKEAKEMLNA